MANTHLKIDNLSFSYNKKLPPVFSNIYHDFYNGDIVGLVGKNGSGKTTLLNCLSGLYHPTSGKITLNNIEVEKVRSDISIISSKFDMFDYLSIEDNIKFFLEFYGKKYEQFALINYMKKYELMEYRKTFVFEASKGMLKKTQIITSLLLKPKILLADEPTESLDEKSKQIFFNDIKELSREHGVIIIYTLHDINLITKNSNKIIRLKNGLSNLVQYSQN